MNEKVSAKDSCKKCGAEFLSEQEAKKYFDSHYHIGKVVGVYYDQHKKCPVKIQKDVAFEIVESGWSRN